MSLGRCLQLSKRRAHWRGCGARAGHKIDLGGKRRRRTGAEPAAFGSTAGSNPDGQRKSRECHGANADDDGYADPHSDGQRPGLNPVHHETPAAPTFVGRATKNDARMVVFQVKAEFIVWPLRRRAAASASRRLPACESESLSWREGSCGAIGWRNRRSSVAFLRRWSPRVSATSPHQAPPTGGAFVVRVLRR